MLPIGTRVIRATDDHKVGLMGTVILRDVANGRYVIRWDDDSTEAIHGSKLAVPYHQR